jgi:adenylate kinase
MTTGSLFEPYCLWPRTGMRVVVTGQVGLDKQSFLEQVVAMAAENGIPAALCNVGAMMYKEAPDVPAGRILDLPISRLNALRRAVFRDILAMAAKSENILINTHATFRWRHGLFPAFDHDLIMQFQPNLFVTLVDNIDAVHLRLLREHNTDHSLKDLLVWREEEILATEVLATVIRGYGYFFVASRGSDRRNIETLYRLIFQPKYKKVYASFPMSHMRGLSRLQAEIDRFRRTMADHFICFDPGDLEEKQLQDIAVRAAEENRRYITIPVLGEDVPFAVTQLLEAAGDINAQIYARDFKFIEQSDMIVSYIPAGEAGRPLISSGVERELQHAHESAKDAYIIWTSKIEPSPFITETATRVFTGLDEAMAFFHAKGYIKSYQRQL